MTLFLEDASSPGNPCPAGSTVSTSVTADSGLQASFNNAPAGSISFSVSSNVDQVTVPVVLSQDGNGGFSVSVVGDPITWYGGKKIKFWFPNYKLMPMLQTPEMTIWASTFEGPTLDYQWFERFAGLSVSVLLSLPLAQLHCLHCRHQARLLPRQVVLSSSTSKSVIRIRA